MTLTPLSRAELERIHAGMFEGVVQTLRDGYRGALNWGMAGIGGWQMASQLYGANVSLGDRWKLIKAVHHGLDQWGGLPDWAPRF